MLTKRAFLAGSGAAVGAAALGTSAQAYDVPANHMPILVNSKPEWGPNEIHVDPNRFVLYYTLGGGRAVRYIVGVGRPGLYESGTFTIGAKKEWPSWRPTNEMIEREPHKYKKYEDGVPGGPDNPLGSRALYLFRANGGDSFLRIHGTTAPWTIGSAVSNGCARLVNAHIEHLYKLVPKGAKVVLYPQKA